MIEKRFVEKDGGTLARVTFAVPGGIWANQIHLVGDFNDWNRTSHPFIQGQDGNWSITMDFPCGRAYQFRYLCDEECWFNDNKPDAWVYNQYGSDNCVLITDPTFVLHAD